MRKTTHIWQRVLSFIMVMAIALGLMPTIQAEAASQGDRLYHIDLKINAEVTYSVYKDGVLTTETVNDAVVSDVSMYYTATDGTKTYLFLTDVSQADKSNNYYEYFMYGYSTSPTASIKDSTSNREYYRQRGNFAYGGTVTISYTMTHTNPITGKTVVGTHTTTQTLTMDTNVCSEKNSSGTSRGFDAYVVHEHSEYDTSEMDLTLTKVWDTNGYTVDLPESIEVAIKTNNLYKEEQFGDNYVDENGVRT